MGCIICWKQIALTDTVFITGLADGVSMMDCQPTHWINFMVKSHWT